MKTGILIGYYLKRQDARDAFKKIRRKGFRRVAWVSKSLEGTLRVGDPFFGRLLFWSVTASILCAALALASSFLYQPSMAALFSVSGASIGFLLSLALFRRSWFGIERKLLRDHARWLINGDTALIIRAPIERLRFPMDILLETGEIAPSVFVLHPRRKNTVKAQDVRRAAGAPLGSAQLQEQGRRLAAEQRVHFRPARKAELLRRLKRLRTRVRLICRDLAEAEPLQQSVSPTAEWVLDNEYLLESNARDVRLNLPWPYYRQLPTLASGNDRGLPRIYGLARELVADTELLLDEENILSFVEAYQTGTSLSIGELWALPQMLRAALIEGIAQLAGHALVELREQELADFWANRLIVANRRDPAQLFSVMAELTENHPKPSPHFASQLIDYLYDEGPALLPVQLWLERSFQKPLNEIILRAKNRQTKDQISIGNAFTSLRSLSVLDWKVCFERLSRVEAMLRRDPAGIYPQMDFATRDSYRRAVEDLRRGSGLEEEDIVARILELATSVLPAPADERDAHVGTYLIGEKRSYLARQIGCRETLRFRALRWGKRHHTAVYFLGLSTFTAGFMVSAFALGLGRGLDGGNGGALIGFFLAALLLIPATQLAIEVLNSLIMGFFPPHSLPKMDFRETGIPDSCRTLVVVPMMLTDAKTIRAEAEKLEIRYLANKEQNLIFALYSDYLDADVAHNEGDAELLTTAKESVEALNRRYGGGRFFLFHRERTWCKSERKFIGWERKRGKLEELNDLIVGTRASGAAPLVYVGDPDRLSDLRYVITLDSDTQLPAGAARRLVEAMAHPLNRAQVDATGKVGAGYTIIQPGVAPSLPSMTATPFSRLFSDAVGIDPYNNTVSDVYQDLTGEGTYHGKGIYDVRSFSRILSRTFPEGRLLSHDLIEGAHVRVGLASDIDLYDEFPQDYQSYLKRQHRWIRGDWQIASWLWSKVPTGGGGRGPNPLSAFSRWKILDNLRRSLLSASSLALLICAWVISPQVALIAGGVVAVQLLFHSLVQPFAWATSGHGLKDVSPAKIVHDLLRVLVEAALLPYQTWLTLDAVGRVWYRITLSHRGLLEWTSAQAAHAKALAKTPAFLWSLSAASAFSVLVFWAIRQVQPANLGMAVPWLAVWFLSPAIGFLLSRRPKKERTISLLAEKDKLFLRKVSRRAWRYFSDFVNEKTSWLPPDNYQVAFGKGLALRTSPTNIGLYLVSALAAHDFGYETIDEVAHRIGRTLETMEKLERHEGHLLNWYDIQTLAPLQPRYVSTVDSGNLLGSLWTLERGLESLMNASLLDGRVFAGLRDTLSLLQGRLKSDRTLDKTLASWTTPPESLAASLKLLRRADRDIESLTASGGDADFWLAELARQRAAWLDIADRYLAWTEILGEKTEGEIAAAYPTFLPIFRQTMRRAPSLRDLAGGNIPCVSFLQEIREKGAISLIDWSERVLEAYGRAKWLAGEMLDQLQNVGRSCHMLSTSINMRFLYNTQRRLFSIGFNVSEGRLDHAFYDLLASEARLGSFIAIARGDVPIEHWFAMGRPYGAVARRTALLSWTGTMFEYLMPLLFQRSYDNTLLDKAAKEAVAIQIAYGHARRVPWGISESAFTDLDFQKTYQYQAFGVPELALKRGLAGKLVVAPYATLLALTVEPRKAVRNLKRLAKMGMLGDYGFYEALDYSRPMIAGGAVVSAYMAHHQGMGFLSLTNFLHDDCLRLRFHTDPLVRTVEPLLQERIPHLPELYEVSTRERVSSVAGIGEDMPSVSQFETPQTATPKTQLLSNGRYHLMLTNSGGGYSRWGDFDLTRWRADATADSWGTFCYLREADSERVWCNTYQPVGGKVDQFCANFALDRAVFRRVDAGIESETEIILAGEDDVEIRRMTLTNRSIRTRRIRLTTYIELALAPHNADRQHPAFNKLFIRTEALEGPRVLLAYRRPRSESERPIYVAHRITTDRDEGGDETFRFETDRRRFIGRGRTLADPMGTGVGEDDRGSQGFVLDPILSLGKTVSMAPGQHVQVSLILAAGSSREQVLGLMDKYGDPRAIERAIDFAWTSAQLELHLLRIQGDDARRFQEMASHLLYPNALLRTGAQRITENRKGQSGLWAYGISGDYPIVLVAIGETRDLGLIRQMIQAHSYWHMHGLLADLVILNEEASGYTQPLREELGHLIQSHSAGAGVDTPGGIFLRSAEAITKEDLTLLQAAATVVLVAARGTLPQQLASPTLDEPAFGETMARKREIREPSAALPFMDLPFFNSLGGFTADGREYAIYLGPGMSTPAPWTNVIANPTFGTLVSETGAGFTWFGNSQRNRLTSWSNDPVVDPPSEAIYLRDEETGSYWTVNAAPIREDNAYRARHGAGYSVFEHNSHGIEQQLTVFVPMDDAGGEPIKLQILSLRNDSDRPRKLSLTYYVEWTLGEAPESSRMQVVTSWDDEAHALLATNRYHPDYGDSLAFASLSETADSYTGDRTIFLGRNRTMEKPAAMERAGLSLRTGAGLDPCAALRFVVQLEPGARKEITCMLGEGRSVDQARALVRAYRDDSATQAALRRTQTWWNEKLGTIQVHTPELAADIMINRWLLYQSLSCRIWGRSGPYQSGGAFGFRDQLQDVMALLYAHPALARRHILLAASRQFVEGDVQHWWHPPLGAGIRSRISDDLLWLPFVVAQYLRVTSDTGILSELVPFLDAPVLNDNQDESFQSPTVSGERATLFEHCRRALDHSRRTGEHGLPLMGTGDWNDGMNLVGAGGTGESVWLAWFRAEVLSGMVELAGLLTQDGLAFSYEEERKTLIEHIEAFAWDGDWYLRATYDDGTPLGSAANTEARIDSLSQSWAALSGGAETDRVEKALESAWNHLVREGDGLVLLFEPPFDHALPSPGYIKGYPPGVRENGGQYTHAAVWLGMAMARRGDGDRAAKILRMLNPIEHTREPEAVWRYGVEPYVVAADVYDLPGRVGQGGWSWYTGSAAWMYRAWVEEILGFTLRGETLRIAPVIPAWWDGFNMTYRHGEALYEIEVDNPDHIERGVSLIELDGKQIPDGLIPLEKELVKHRIRIRMGSS